MRDHDQVPEMHAPSSGVLGMLAFRTDLLSQMLTLVRLQGELVFSAELTQPWALRFEAGSAYFYVVSEGAVTIEVDGASAIHAVTGDLLMLPRGIGHIVSDGGSGAPASASRLMTEQFTAERLSLSYGGEGTPTKLIVGAFHFASESVPWVVSSLPAVIHIRKAEGRTAGWLEGLAYFMLVEAHEVHPGSSVMISRLIDVLVIRILRTWVQTEKAGDTGWLGALADARISRALKAIHDEPFRRWSVADLANVAGMSRSSFAERFSALVKEPPLSYQSRWRLALAHTLLRKADARVSDVARQVGYESEAAFSRAFKSEFGMAPVRARESAPRRIPAAR
jgi:AraC-like DNA-binding protein